MAYRTYPRRWGVLLSVVVCNISSIMMVASIFPVAPMAAKYFNIDGGTMDLMVILGNICNFTGMIAAIYCVNCYGLQTSIRFGSTCLAIGSIIRFFSTFPSYEENIEPKTKWWLTLSGQVVNAIGHPFIVTISTKVSQAWFSEKERIFSTASMVMASPVGGIIGSALSPVIVNGKAENIPYLNIYYPVVGVVGCIMAWSFFTTPLPPTPPSASAELDITRIKTPLTLKDSLVTSKKLFKNKTIMCLTVVMGFGFGMYQILLTQLGQILCVTGYPRNAAGISGAAMISAGVIGSLFIGPLARRLKRLEDFTKVFFCLANVALIFLFLSLREENFFPGILAALIAVGFCGIGCMPLVSEMSAEEVYPINPVFPEAFLRFSEGIWSLILVSVGNALHWDLSANMLKVQNCRTEDEEIQGVGIVPWDYTPYFYFLMALCAAGALSILCFIKTSMNREKIDHQEHTSQETENNMNST